MSGFISLEGDYRTSSDMCFYFRVTKGETYRYQSTGDRSLGAIFDSVPTENHTPCIDGTFFNPLSKQTAFVAPASGIMVIYTNLGFSQEVMDSFQVEKGTEATSVVPHKGQTFTFPLGNEKLMLGDYLADDGIHHVRGKIRITSDDFNISIDGAVCFPKRKQDSNFYKSIEGLCSHFVNKKSDSIISVNPAKSQLGDGQFNFRAGNTKDRIYFKNSNFTTVADWTNFFDNNQVILEYELIEEQIVPYTPEQQTVYNQIKQAISYEGQTNISNNQIALFNVEAYQSTKLILENIDSRLTLVEG